MQTPSMDTALRQAWLQAPGHTTVSDTAAASQGAGNDPTAQDPMQDILRQFDAFTAGGGASSSAASLLPASLQSAPPAASTDPSTSTSPVGLSSPAQIFKNLGVDPNSYSLSAQRDQVKFNLQMEDDQMQVGTQGNVNYQQRSLNLQVNLTTTHGSIQNNGGQVNFDQLKLDISFSYDQTQASSGAADGSQAPAATDGSGGGSSPNDAFSKLKDQFLKTISDALDQFAQNGDMSGDPKAMAQFALDLGKKLFDLMDGVTQVGQNDAKRATYDNPAKVTAGNSKLDNMQKVADQLTQQTEELQNKVQQQTAPDASTTGSTAASITSPLDLLAPTQPAPAAKAPAAPSSPPIATDKPATDKADRADEDKKVLAKMPQPLMKPFLATQPQAAANSSLNVKA